MAKREMFVTFNALRRYLQGRGCAEVRELELVSDEPKASRTYVNVECFERSGRMCSGSFAYEKGRAAAQVEPDLLAALEQALARCLGREWTMKIDEDPFG